MDLLIDEARLQEISDGDATALRHLIHVFLENTALEFKHLTGAIALGNAVEVHRITHSIVGAAMTYGMVGMVEPLRRFEAEAKAGRLEQALALQALSLDCFEKIKALLLLR
jgi:HPt (histidine-containing phosphotransfer) domain-containing protein